MLDAAVLCLASPGAGATEDGGGEALQRMLGVLTQSQDDCIAQDWQRAQFVIMPQPQSATMSVLTRARPALEEYDQGARGLPRPRIGLHYGQVFSLTGTGESPVYRGSAMSRARAVALAAAAGQCVATREFRDFVVAHWPAASSRLAPLRTAAEDPDAGLFLVDISGLTVAAQPRREAGERPSAGATVRVLAEEAVAAIGALLADHIGPVAIPLAEEAARASKQPDAFIALLAAEIPASAARAQFVADARLRVVEAAPAAPTEVRPLGGRTIKAIAALLAEEIGPVAAALAEEAARISRQPDAFIALLAGELPTPEQRSQFVTAARLLVRER
jgi:hypothetical protein